MGMVSFSPQSQEWLDGLDEIAAWWPQEKRDLEHELGGAEDERYMPQKRRRAAAKAKPSKESEPEKKKRRRDREDEQEEGGETLQDGQAIEKENGG